MASMRKGSIALRLLWLSAAWLVIALVGTALLLTELYQRSLDNQLTETLESQLKSLIAGIVKTDDPKNEGIATADPRYLKFESGWYWTIRDEARNIVNVSDNLSVADVNVSLPEIATPFDDTNTRTAIDRDSTGIRMRMVEREITLENRKFYVLITGNLDEISQFAERFRGQALIVLGAVGAMLAIMSAIGARIALRPVGRLRAAVEAVREGETERIVGTFPYEIAPLAEEVNALLRSNDAIIERSRSQVGNLAHGLKTPLAVLRNESEGKKTPLARIVKSESEKMMQIVTQYLDMARMAARTKIVGRKTDAAQCMTRLVRVMSKVHPSKTVRLQPVPANVPWFRGEESDLEEMTGNLLDNACKWAASEVTVTLADDTWAGSRALKITIEDNGKGLTEDEAKAVLRRGVRLDEKTPGSGLGLDIVKELVDVYDGGFVLGRAALGGLRAELLLPAARPAAKPPRP